MESKQNGRGRRVYRQGGGKSDWLFVMGYWGREKKRSSVNGQRSLGKIMKKPLLILLLLSLGPLSSLETEYLKLEASLRF